MDEELDNFLDNFVNPQDDWNIQNEKNYFSVKEVVAKANQDLANEKTKKRETQKAKPSETKNPETKIKKRQSKKKKKKIISKH